jgi:hypothetical protein
MNQIACWGLVVIGLAGCGSTPTLKVGSLLENPRMNFKATLPAPGKLFIAQKIEGKKPGCDEMKTSLSVTMRKDGDNKVLNTIYDCKLMPGNIVAITKDNVGKGDYAIRVERALKPQFKEKPQVLARYADPDFNAGPEYLIDGAKELAAGQAFKGVVSYPQGATTQWVRLKGKSARVGLTLIQGPEARDLTVQVYENSPSSKGVTLVATLLPKKKKMLSLKEDNLLVKISAKAYAGSGEFSLVRSDGEAAKGGAGAGVSIPVVDCYQVSESASVVLLESGKGGLKVNDEVRVFGKKTSGENIALGNCQVTSIVGTQASCRLDEAVGAGFVEYHAEAKGT